MKTRMVTIFRAIISIILTLVVVWSIRAGNSILVVVVIFIGFVASFLLRKEERVRVDERIQLINEKSATATLNSFILGITLIGVVLLTLENSGYAGFSLPGFTLLYSSCALMILNMIFRIFYRQKYGG